MIAVSVFKSDCVILTTLAGLVGSGPNPTLKVSLYSLQPS